MQTTLNIARLHDLLAYLHEITDVQISLHNPKGKEVYSIYSRSAFCDLICNTEEGHARCVACDMRAADRLSKRLVTYEYRCHTGLIDSIIPVTDYGHLVALIMFGQLLDETPIEAQWAITEPLVSWYPQQRKLKEAYWELPQLSKRQIRACYEIINACVSEMRLEGILRESEQTDAQRLENFINTNYANPLTIASIEQALSISKSKLYLLAEQIEPGATVMGLVTRRRVDAARKLLRKQDATVREVAELVGIPDYNYFTKVFRKATGQTPSLFRAAEKQR